MTEHAAQAFTDVTLHIDGERFLDCEFRGATLVYAGGPLPFFEGCHFHNCTWRLDDAADRTRALISFLYDLGPADLRASLDRLTGRRA